MQLYRENPLIMIEQAYCFCILPLFFTKDQADTVINNNISIFFEGTLISFP